MLAWGHLPSPITESCRSYYFKPGMLEVLHGLLAYYLRSERPSDSLWLSSLLSPRPVRAADGDGVISGAADHVLVWREPTLVAVPERSACSKQSRIPAVYSHLSTSAFASAFRLLLRADADRQPRGNRSRFLEPRLKPRPVVGQPGVIWRA